MWENACEKFPFSVWAVTLADLLPDNKVKNLRTIGTSFAITKKPGQLFLTCAHVVRDFQHQTNRAKRLVILGHVGLRKMTFCYVSPKFLWEDLDLAVLEAAEIAEEAIPVTFSEPDPIKTGAAVASIGFPVPPDPELTPAGGKLRTERRLATGFVSSPDSLPKFDQATASLKHLEMNMLSYPGLSGAPVFNAKGLVVGINRGSLAIKINPRRSEWEKYPAAYAYAVRNIEIIPRLKENQIEVRS